MKNVVIFLMALVISGCGFNTKQKKEDQSTNSEDVTVSLVQFPHPENFRDISQHGYAALSVSGKKQCTGCHEMESAVAANGKAIACKSCHENYPHKEGIKDNHGLLAKKDMTQCIDCHMSEKNLTAPAKLKPLLPPTCNSCHSSYPHPKEWNSKNEKLFHGNVVIRELIDDKGQKVELGQSCKQCHGEKLQGKDTAPSCASCHGDVFPHKMDIKDQHGKKEFDLPSKLEDCGTCHNTSPKYTKVEGTADRFKNESCNTCHTSYPHFKAEWMSKESKGFHGVVAKETKDFAGCKSCHGQDLGINASNGKSCYTCHNDYPHTKEWKETRIHGSKYVTYKVNPPLSGANNCISCHGQKLDGNGVKEKSCDNCHKQFPAKHLEQNFIIDHMTIGSRIPKGDKACLGCHLDNNWPKPFDFFPAGNQNYTCQGCHHKPYFE